MGETLTNLDKILKDVYEPIVTDQVSTFDPVQELFEEVEDAQWEGRQALEMTNMSYNEGVGATAEGGNLPTAGNFDPQNFAIPMKYLNASFQMTKQMIESAKTSKGAFKNAMNMSMDTVITNLRREQARMLYGFGKGILAYTNCSGAQTTVVVDTPGGATNATGGARYIRKNMILACINPSDGTMRSGTVHTATAVTATGLSYTAASTTFTDSDYIVRCNTTSETAAAGTGYNKEPMGLLGLIDDTTYAASVSGLARATYPQLNSRVQSSVGALSLDAIQANIDIADQLGDSKIDAFACHHAVRRAYLSLLEADRRYTSTDLMKPDGGTVAGKGKGGKSGNYVTFAGIPMMESKYAPYDILFGIDKRYFKKYTQVKGEWANDSGAILRQVTGQDTWTAFYRRWLNYHCSKPNTCFRMDGITTNKVYVASY
jgi:hypothetical protein